jgi:hypothetical protein
MAKIGKWGKKIFKSTAKIVLYPDGFERSVKGKRAEITNLPKGKEPEAISFELHVGTAAGVDVRKEVDWWMKKVNKSGALMIGTKRWGAKAMILDSCKISDVVTAGDGLMVEATIELDMTAKPTKKEVKSALKADAKERAKSASSAKEKKKILGPELKKAVKAANKVWKKT